MIETLVSEKNPLLKEIRRAISRGTLTEDGFALAEGPHLLDEAVRAGLEINTIVVAESAQESIGNRTFGSARVIAVPNSVFTGLASTETPQGVLALMRLPDWTVQDIFSPPSLVIVLDGIQDPGNAGAIVRTAEAFGATGAIFLKGTVSPYNPKTLRGSAGSLFRLPFIAGLEQQAFLDLAEEKHINLYYAAPRAGMLLQQTDLKAGCAVVIGSEGGGVRSEIAKRAVPVTIPTSSVESLNAAVAAGIFLYEARRQRGAE